MNPSPQTVARAEKLLALMRKSPELGVWKSRTSRLFRVWAKECGIGEIRAYAVFEGCIVHLGVEGLVQRVGGNWELVGEVLE